MIGIVLKNNLFEMESSGLEFQVKFIMFLVNFFVLCQSISSERGWYLYYQA